MIFDYELYEKFIRNKILSVISNNECDKIDFDKAFDMDGWQCRGYIIPNSTIYITYMSESNFFENDKTYTFRYEYDLKINKLYLKLFSENYVDNITQYEYIYHSAFGKDIVLSSSYERSYGYSHKKGLINIEFYHLSYGHGYIIKEIDEIDRYITNSNTTESYCNYTYYNYNYMHELIEIKRFTINDESSKNILHHKSLPAIENFITNEKSYYFNGEIITREISECLIDLFLDNKESPFNLSSIGKTMTLDKIKLACVVFPEHPKAAIAKDHIESIEIVQKLAI